MKLRRRKFRALEKKFLRVYSAWEETHRWEFADASLRLLGELLQINPRYSLRHHFDQAF